MVAAEKWALIKSYNPERTPIQEIDDVNKKIQFEVKNYAENSDSWDFIAVDNWQKRLRDLRAYKDFLKSLC